MSQLLPRSAVRKLSVSVVVPCAEKHVPRLPEVLSALSSQVRRPDEIIVAVSGCDLSALPNLSKFAVNVTHSRNRASAGANRNRGSAVACGDVIVYQDADDLPHRQRIEFIAGLFEQYEIDHLMHFYDLLKEKPSQFTFETAVARSAYRTAYVRGVTHGNVAVARSIFSAVKWPDYFRHGEDRAFNTAVYRCSKRTVITELALLTYRRNFSTFRR